MKKQMDNASVGADLLAYRKKNNKTREDIASKIGVSSRTIERWENGKHKPISMFLLRQIKKLKLQATS